MESKGKEKRIQDRAMRDTQHNRNPGGSRDNHVSTTRQVRFCPEQRKGFYSTQGFKEDLKQNGGSLIQTALHDKCATQVDLLEI